MRCRRNEPPVRWGGSIVLRVVAIVVLIEMGEAVWAGELPGEPLDLVSLAREARAIELDEERLRALLVKRPPESVSFAPAVASPAGSLVAWSECNLKTCVGYAARLEGDAEHLSLTKKIRLPLAVPVFAVEGYRFHSSVLADLDGDGTKEWLLHVEVSEPPRSALGSLVHEYLVVFNVPALSLAFLQELGRRGGDSEPACTWEVRREVRAGRAMLTVLGRCGRRDCLEAQAPVPGCPPTRQSRARFVWVRGKDRFVAQAMGRRK
jgi:hypothetical protein